MSSIMMHGTHDMNSASGRLFSASVSANNEAKQLMMQKRHAAANAKFEEALQMRERALGTTDYRLCIVLSEKCDNYLAWAAAEKNEGGALLQQCQADLTRMRNIAQGANDPEQLRIAREIQADVDKATRPSMSGQGTTNTTNSATAVVPVVGGHTCITCGVSQREMMRCSRCKVTDYCSAKCQKAHWKQHKKTCSAPQ